MSKAKANKTKKASRPSPKAKTAPKAAKVSVNGKPSEKPSIPMQAGLAAVEAIPPKPAKETKLETVIKLLRRPEGATIDELTAVTGWQKHTVRAALSHTLAKKRGYQIVSEKPTTGYSVVSNKPERGNRTYKIVEQQKDDH